MAVLKLSVSGPPGSGKTALLSFIRNCLANNNIVTVCETESLANNPKMEISPNSIAQARNELANKNVGVVLEELYRTKDGAWVTNHSEQAPPEVEPIPERYDPLR